MEKENKPEEKQSRRRRVKKVKGHGGHHGGAWKVAYADFVTAMMALFLVLWLVSQADTKLKEEIANYFRSPGVFSSTDGGILKGKKKVSKEPQKLTAEEEDQLFTTVAKSLQQNFDSQLKSINRVKVTVVEEGLRIDILDKADDVSFEVGKAVLNEQAKEILSEIADEICKLPNKIRIGGHTDKRNFPSKNGYSNWELSADRANAARRELEAICLDPSQISRVTGYADTDPIIPRDPYAPANRRISITVLRMHKKDGGDSAENEESDSESVYLEESSSEQTDEINRKKPDKTTDIASTQKPKIKTTEKNSIKDEKSEEADATKTSEKTISNESKQEPKTTNPNSKEIKVGKPDIVPNKPKIKEKNKTNL